MFTTTVAHLQVLKYEDPPMQLRPTHAVIDLKALKHNFNEAKKRLPKGCGVLTMVKADAYGHGAIEVAKIFEGLQTDCLGVATIEEGIELREGGLKSQILVMGGLLGSGKEGAEAMLQHDLTPVVHSAGVVEILEDIVEKQEARSKKQEARSKKQDKNVFGIHLKIDTGMSRLGVTPQALPYVLERLKKTPHLKLEGVMTHLAWRQNPEYTRHQTQIFKEAVKKIMETVGEIPIIHIANSAAVLEGCPVDTQLDPSLRSGRQCWARPGIMLYGIPPYPEFKTKADLKPVMSLASKIVLIKQVPKGTKISYNCTHTTTRESRIGVVPIGYADGYPWALSNKAHVLVCGKRAPILGRVTMDMVMVDLTDIQEAEVGSEVVLLGWQGTEQIDADALADWGNTIAYEIVCRVSKRMPRVYKQ